MKLSLSETTLFASTPASEARQPFPRAARLPHSALPGHRPPGAAGTAERPPRAVPRSLPLSTPLPHHQQSPGRAALRPLRPLTDGTALLPGTLRRGRSTVKQARGGREPSGRQAAARPRRHSRMRVLKATTPRSPCRKMPKLSIRAPFSQPRSPGPAAAPSPGRRGLSVRPRLPLGGGAPMARRGEARPAPASAAHGGGGGDVATGWRGRAPPPRRVTGRAAPPLAQPPAAPAPQRRRGSGAARGRGRAEEDGPRPELFAAGGRQARPPSSGARRGVRASGGEGEESGGRLQPGHRLQAP